MKFKNDVAKLDYGVIPEKLRKMCEDFETFSLFYGIDPVVTRIREGVCGDSGVHEAGRAVDFRNQYILPDGSRGFLYRSDQWEDIVHQMNLRYPRADKRPSCIHHSFERGPMHFHIQLEATQLLPGEPLPRPKIPD